VLGGFLLHLVLGTLYMFANITTYITAHLRNYEPTVTYDDMILVFATSIGVQGVFMLIGGIIETSIGAKYTCLLGSYILVFGILLSSQAKSYLEILIFYGAFFGVGLGLAYSPPISASAKWFPAHKGLVTGIIISGFGGGAFIFGTFANFITNPDNIAVSSSGYFESDGPIANNVPCMYLYLGVSYFMTVTLACYLISEPDDSSLAYSNGKHVGYQIAESDDSHFKVPEESREFEPLQLIRIPLAWHLATCLVTTALGGMFLAGSFKTFALTKVSSLSLARIRYL
jgi:OFA family oxalate/formate antiporter-like MFS transporter